MANIKLTIGSVNITNYLIVTASKVTSPGVEAAREVFAPGTVGTSFNVLLPSTGSIDAGTYYVTYRESADGTTLGQILGQFTYDATNKVPISETRFYQTGGPRDIDPDADQTDLIDPYLDGKDITQVIKEGFRPLVPPTLDFKEYDLIAGGGIRLLNGQLFNMNEVLVIEITYTKSQDDASSNAGMYDGVILITADTTLNDTHRNQRLKCESLTSRLVITLENLSSVPEGKFYYLSSNGGNQSKVRILPVSGQKILLNGQQYDEISIGRGEYARIEKYTTFWDVITRAEGLVQVGERVGKGVLDTINLLPENGSLIDGDDEPRLYYWVKKLPVSHVVSALNVADVSYVHPVGKEGMFVVHPTLRKFRMPNSQGWYYRGLKDYVNYNTDTTQRPFDYPGGTEQGAVGPHTHNVPIPKEKTSKTQEGTPRIVGGGDGNEPVALNPLTTDIPTGPGSGSKNLVQDIGEVWLRRS